MTCHHRRLDPLPLEFFSSSHPPFCRIEHLSPAYLSVYHQLKLYSCLPQSPQSLRVSWTSPTMPSALNHGGPSHPTLQLSYEERASLPNTSPLAAYVFRLCSAKKTNLCVSADVTSTAELLQLAEEVGDSICILKTHADIIQDFSHRTMAGLQRIARKRGFLVFEDRKFGDIGSE